MTYIPLQICFEGKAVLVVGGGPVALRKAKLLLEGGAQVKAVAPSVVDGFEHVSGLEICRRHFQESDLDGVMLVVVATDDPQLNASIVELARKRGILACCAGEPAQGDTLFCSVVRRGPLSIGISTGGAVPALSRVIREHLDREIPDSFALVADYLAKLRQESRTEVRSSQERADVNRRLANLAWQMRHTAGQSVTRILQALASRDGSTVDGASDVSAEATPANLCSTHVEYRKDRERARGNRKGKLILVGAGPGDPRLITLAGIDALSSADLVIYDRLVSPELLKFAPQAVHIRVGEHKAGKVAEVHARIDQLILEHSRSGRCVVRLKGGDPMIFGRAAQELAVARKAGIPCLVIPGITSACAAAAVEQIPLTARGIAGNVTFVTGHRMAGIAPLDWEQLARACDTIVVYMGAATASEIAQQLLQGGRSAGEPVAVIFAATWQTQEVTYCTLRELAEGRLAGKLNPPCAIIIGPVVTLGKNCPEKLVKEVSGRAVSGSFMERREA